MAIRTSFSRFARDDRGATATVFAISLVPLMAVIGVAVDGVRWQSARHQTSAAIDSAVLAGARQMQINANDTAGALTTARNYYQANIGGRTPVTQDTVDFALSDNNTTIASQGAARIKTVFLSIVGVDELPIVAPAASKAAIPGGLNGGSNIEVSLMLDVTGSMCDDGQGPCATSAKVQGLRDAATDLVNIVVRDDQSIYTSRVAIVPFSTRIRVDVDNHDGWLMKKLTNLDLTWSGWFDLCIAGSGGGGGENGNPWSCQQYQSTYMTNWKLMPCVTERLFAGNSMANAQVDFTDDLPSTGKWLNAHGGDRAPLFADSADSAPLTSTTGQSQADPTGNWNYEVAGRGCEDAPEQNRVIPLSADKTLLTTRIAQFSAAGATNGVAATAWSWYMLSPKWSSIWTGAAQPGAYSDLTAKQTTGAPVLRKVAVIMTDGVFNALRGWKDQDQAMVSDRAKQTCTAMKAQNIEIYTVGFALDQLAAPERVIAEDLLKSCGTDIKHFYSTLTVPELKTAFRDIAMKVSPVRLTQ